MEPMRAPTRPKDPRLLALVSALLLFATVPRPVAGQQIVHAAGIVAGASQYDLSGTGTAPFASFRLNIPVGRNLVLEPALGFLSYEAQSGRRYHHILPEIQIQAQAYGARVRPYLGVGFGASWAVRPQEDQGDPTLSGAGGLRVILGTEWMLRGELRVRIIDPWGATTADWGLGLSRRF